MKNKILKEEILNEEQLDLVNGGTWGEAQVDKKFFLRLYPNLLDLNVRNAFEENGIMCTSYQGEWGWSNEYRIKVNGEWCKHPHFAALGYVLAQRHYPGFNGSWTDSKYVHSFLKEHFDISDLG